MCAQQWRILQGHKPWTVGVDHVSSNSVTSHQKQESHHRKVEQMHFHVLNRKIQRHIWKYSTKCHLSHYCSNLCSLKGNIVPAPVLLQAVDSHLIQSYSQSLSSMKVKFPPIPKLKIVGRFIIVLPVLKTKMGTQLLTGGGAVVNQSSWKVENHMNLFAWLGLCTRDNIFNRSLTSMNNNSFARAAST